MKKRFIHLLLSLVAVGLLVNCSKDDEPNFAGEIEFDGETYVITRKDSRIIKWHCWDCHYTNHYNLDFNFNINNQSFSSSLHLFSLGDAFEWGSYIYDDYRLDIVETETGLGIAQTSGGEVPDFSFFNSSTGFSFGSGDFHEGYHKATGGIISVEAVSEAQLKYKLNFYKLNFDLTVENKDGVIKPLRGFFHGAFEKREEQSID